MIYNYSLFKARAGVNPGALPVLDDTLNDHFCRQRIAAVNHLELATFLWFLQTQNNANIEINDFTTNTTTKKHMKWL